MSKAGPWDDDDFKIPTGALTKAGTPGFIWDTTMKGARV